jgi:hypothetical protein
MVKSGGYDGRNVQNMQERRKVHALEYFSLKSLKEKTTWNTVCGTIILNLILKETEF